MTFFLLICFTLLAIGYTTVRLVRSRQQRLRIAAWRIRRAEEDRIWYAGLGKTKPGCES